jgi:hypothetical protein
MFSHYATPVARRLTSLLAAAALLSCSDLIIDPDLPPVIDYDSPMTFTVGVADSKDPLSTGGPVASYSIFPAPPAGLEMDVNTGVLAGVALEDSPEAEYRVIAAGPGGSDTALILLRVVALPIEPGTPRPQIAYASPVTDTAGKPAAHAVISTGGPVTGFSTPHDLPRGLSLNASTGLISGTATQVAGMAGYTVIAYGPGGRDTAVITITVTASPSVPPPVIAYASPVTDTVDKPAFHAVISTGGPVTSYSMVGGQGLPLGLGLSVTNTISAPAGTIYGTPYVSDILLGRTGDSPVTYFTISTGDYRIVAHGPGGSDTATINITVVGPPTPPVETFSGMTLSVNIQSGLGTVLAKTSALSLKKMIVTLTSNLSSDMSIRDTILAGTPGFGAGAVSGRVLLKTYALKPLRTWLAFVQISDTRDSLVYSGSVAVANLLAGQTRAANLNLISRFAPYNGQILFPGIVGGGAYPVTYSVKARRIVLVVAGDTVREMIAPNGGYFASTPVAHVLEYDYLRTGVQNTMSMHIYGHAHPPASSSLGPVVQLFSASYNYLPTGGAHTPQLSWVGPSLGTPIP